MRISVIIPTYNRAATLERAIQAVLDQSYPASEIIVIDDASTDHTTDILQKYATSIHTITNQQNRGVSYSRNAGINAAQSEWIAFLDSDDEWDPQKLAQQKQFHEAHPRLSISQCEEIWIRNGIRVNPMEKHAKKGGWIFDACIPLCIVSPSAVIMHKSIFEHIGVFDVDLLACEDYDLWLRIAPHYEIGLLKEKLVTRYGGHEDQLSRKYWGMDRFRITAMEKHLDSDLDSDSKKILLEELEFKCRIVAEGAKKRNKLDLSKHYFEKQKDIQNRILTELYDI